MDKRAQLLKQWVSEQLKDSVELVPVQGDASFRRYFRVKTAQSSYIAMDSPAEKEDCRPFIRIAEFFKQQGLTVPEILFAAPDQGFLLISDFGDKLYHYYLTSNNVDQYYGLAIDELLKLQQCPLDQDTHLPVFGRQSLLEEFKNFTYWFVEQYLQIGNTANLQALLNETYELLLENAADQPQVCVHRDYHSRNLMMLPDRQVGILDFQDAVIGPVTYDLVSLIRDCYIDWPQEQVYQWALTFYECNQQINVSQEVYLRWFDLMGMQRHLKAIFIFSRKALRDNNNFYLQFIPRALDYVDYVCSRYPELIAFHQYWLTSILPAWQDKVVA